MIYTVIVSYSVIAALIGAGFASGQEMLCYFARFNGYGLLGVAIFSIILGFFMYAVLSFSIKNPEMTYNEFVQLIKNQYLRFLVKLSTVIFSIAVYGAMIAAFSQVLADLLSVPHATGALICTIVSVLLLHWGTEKVFTINGIVGISLVFLIVFACLYMLFYREFHTFSYTEISALSNSIVYSGYNLSAMTPILITLSKKLHTKSQVITSSITSALLTAIIMSLIFVLITMYAGKINLGQLPMLTLARRQSVTFGTMYAVILGVAIITTLLSSGGALVEALSIKGNLLYIALISAIALLLSGIGFSNLVNGAYRLCGIVGVIVCITVIYTCLKANK